MLLPLPLGFVGVDWTKPGWRKRLRRRQPIPIGERLDIQNFLNEFGNVVYLTNFLDSLMNAEALNTPLQPQEPTKHCQ